VNIEFILDPHKAVLEEEYVQSCEDHKVVRTKKKLPEWEIWKLIEVFENEKMPKNLPNVPFNRGMLNKYFYQQVEDKINGFSREIAEKFQIYTPTQDTPSTLKKNSDKKGKGNKNQGEKNKGSTESTNVEKSKEAMNTDEVPIYIFNDVGVKKITCRGKISKLEADTTINELLKHESSNEIIILIANDIDHIVFAIVSILNKANVNWWEINPNDGIFKLHDSEFLQNLNNVDPNEEDCAIFDMFIQGSVKELFHRKFQESFLMIKMYDH